jgi:hypothetical protein
VALFLAFGSKMSGAQELFDQLKEKNRKREAAAQKKSDVALEGDSEGEDPAEEEESDDDADDDIQLVLKNKSPDVIVEGLGFSDEDDPMSGDLEHAKSGGEIRMPGFCEKPTRTVVASRTR